MQRYNCGEFLWSDLCDVGAESTPPGWNRVKASENLGATAVALFVPAVTPLSCKILKQSRNLETKSRDWEWHFALPL